MTRTLLNESSVTLRLDVRFRAAGESDLLKLEWFGQYTHYRALYRRTFEMQQLDGRRLILLAALNDFPIGQIFIHFRDHARARKFRGYLYSLRVLEPFQGQGLGTRLIHEAERILRERGYRQAAIAVAKDNERAKSLYERLGYTVFAEDAGRWQYVDHNGTTREVNEPSWILSKVL